MLFVLIISLLFCCIASAGCSYGLRYDDEISGTGPSFITEVYSHGDEVEVRYVPDIAVPADFLISYDTNIGGTIAQNVQSKQVFGISRDNPIIIVIPRPSGDAIAISMSIQDAGGELLYTDSLAVNAAEELRDEPEPGRSGTTESSTYQG